ncbi:hypothetical protein HYALB_00010837 [Hymenoscyphus albidus]|uniref:Aminoglycoside phosphotransferase domain-containing protein n=1 Tax=Hymenoscyphus albidus TaxID=595503 RepID=A0A9N9PS11_9HELO|nr:hypothetical protein HYALB_00010837 [Hymenoscyphus albidus]
MSRNRQDGLEWEARVIGLVPRWSKEPSIEAIEHVCRQQLVIPPAESCTVSLRTEDAMHRLYSVSGTGRSMLMKVLLPVYPHFKTRGEVATLQWVRGHTNIPVPTVVAFDDSNHNQIGFEWILMEMMPGIPARRRWRTLAMESKMAMVQRLAEFQAELSRRGQSDDAFKNIGTLDLEAEGALATVVPGRLVTDELYMRNRLNYDLPRGPFRSSHDWLHANLRLIILEKAAIIKQGNHDDASSEAGSDAEDAEDAEEVQEAAQRLLSLLPNIFPPTQEDAVATALYHDGLTLSNILLSEQGEITALLDWEGVSAMPTWMATIPPRFLSGQIREDEPIKDEYMNEETGAEASDEHSDPDKLDDEGKNELYWIHRMEYETTQLRKRYRVRMRQLWPDWPEEENYRQVDFFEAFLQCNGEVFIKQVNQWVDRLEKGDSVRWTDMFETEFGV